MVRLKSRVLSLVVLGFIFVTLSPAQQETGSILGTVRDPSGLAVSGAEVTVRNHDTSATFGAVTDATGL